MDLSLFSLLSTHTPSKQGKKAGIGTYLHLHDNFDDCEILTANTSTIHPGTLPHPPPPPPPTLPPTSHRLMQDNDPKHTSRVAQQFYIDSDINWWKTSAESPEMNPIENLWHELKEHIVEKSSQQPNRS